MSSPELDVKYIAGLARIGLADDEVAMFERQLARIVEYVRQLQKLDVDGIEPTAHASPVVNALRADEPRPGLSADEALAVAPQRADDLFAVPKVID